MTRAEEKPRPWLRRTVAGDLTLTLILMMAAIFLAFGVVVRIIVIQLTTTVQVRQTAVLIDNLATALELPLVGGDQAAVTRLAASYEAADNIARVRIMDSTGAMSYETAVSTFNTNDYTLTRDVTHDGQALGMVQVTFTGQSINQIRQNILTVLGTLLLVVLLVIAIIIRLLVRRFVSRPFNTLGNGLETIAEGEYHHRLPEMPQEEFQFIVRRASLMAEQIEQRDQELRALIDALEIRVTERTRDLLLASEIGRSVSQIHDLNTLLSEAVEMICARFGLYHVQIYLVDKTDQNLLLRASSGEIGRQMLAQGHRLPIDQASVNGRAAAEKQTIIVTDTATDLRYLAHPLLPETCAETAVPLIVSQRVVGVLDLQSNNPDALSTERTPALEVLGELLAIAIESARRLQNEARLRADLDENSRFLDSVIENLPIMLFVKEAEDLRFIRWNKAGSDLVGVPAESFIGKTDYDFFPPEEAAFFVQKDREVLAGGQLVDIAEEPIETTDKGQRLLNTIKVPIMDAEGNPRYLLGISQDITERKEAERMLAERIKELRLLNEVGRMIEQRPSIPEFAQFIAQEIPNGFQFSELCRAAINLEGAIYGQPEAINLPCQIVEGIRVRGEQIGRITVAYTEKKIFLNEESALIGEIGRRLSSYIESQRLLQQVQASVTDLQAVTEISLAVAAASQKQVLLQTVADLARERFAYYHTQIYLYDDKNDNLILAAASGAVGQQLIAASNPINLATQETPLTRTALSQHPLVINDTAAEPGFLRHHLLPDTRSQLLLPLAVGETLLGVFDVQADVKDRFTEAEMSIQATLAAQVAVALQNVDRLEQNQAALAELGALQRLMVREGWGDYFQQMDTGVKGYVSSRERLEPITGSNGKKSADPRHAYTYPLQVRGITIGKLGVRQPDGRSLEAEDQRFLEAASVQIAEALEKSRLFAATEQARSQTEALFSGSERVVRAQSTNGILQALIEATALRQMDRASLLFFDRPWQTEPPDYVTVSAIWQREDSPLKAEIGTTFPLAQYPAAGLLNRNEPSIIEDLANDDWLPDTTRTLLRDLWGLTSAIAIPLVAGDLWIGFVLCLSERPHHWQETQLRQIATLANQAATVAQTLRLFAEAQLRAEQEQILRRVSGEVYAAVDAEAVLRTAAEEIGKALGLETFIYLTEGDDAAQDNGDTGPLSPALPFTHDASLETRR